MPDNSAVLFEELDTNIALNRITNVEPLSVEQLKDFCRHLSNNQLKHAYLDCYQHASVIQDKTRKEIYKERCQQLIGVMATRVKENESDFDVLSAGQPNIANRLIQNLLSDTKYLTKIIAYPETFNWQDTNFASQVESTILHLPDNNVLIQHYIKNYTDFSHKNFSQARWYSWLEQLTLYLEPVDFFKLIQELYPDPIDSIMFLNFIKQDNEPLWQAFFNQLSFNHQKGYLLNFVFIAGRKKQVDLISHCYAKAIAKWHLPVESLNQLLEKLLASSLPKQKYRWIDAIITELDKQTQLSNELLLWLVFSLLSLENKTKESDQLFKKAIYLLTKCYCDDPHANWPASDDNAAIAYHMLVDFDALMLIVNKPTGWFFWGNNHLNGLLKHIDITTDDNKIVAQWLVNGCCDWKRFIEIIQSIQSSKEPNGFHLTSLLANRCQSKNYKELINKLSDNEMQDFLYQQLLSPALAAILIENDQFFEHLSHNEAYWQANLSDIVKETNSDHLLKVFNCLPSSSAVINEFWHHATAKDPVKAGSLLVDSLEVDESNAEFTIGWWLSTEEEMLQTLMNGLIKAMAIKNLSIRSLLKLSTLMLHFSKSKNEVSMFMTAWLSACAHKASKLKDIKTHEWIELTQTILSIINELAETNMLSPNISNSASFTTLILEEAKQTKRASIAINLVINHSSLPLDNEVKNNKIFLQQIIQLIKRLPQAKLSTQKRILLLELLPEKKQNALLFAPQEKQHNLLSNTEWVIEHFEFSLELVKRMDFEIIYNQIKKAQDPRPYVDLLMSIGYAELNLNPAQKEQIFYTIREQAHLTRLMQSDVDLASKNQFLSELLDHHHSRNSLKKFIVQLQPDLTCWLILLNHSDLNELAGFIYQNPTWLNMMQKWLINPAPVIDIQPDSLLYQLVVDGFCECHLQSMPDLTLIESLKPADALRVHQSIFKWQHFAQKSWDILATGLENDNNLIMQIINGRWLYQLDWQNQLLFPIVKAYSRHKSNGTLKKLMDKTDLFKFIILPLLDNETPSHDELTNLIVNSQTHLRPLVKDYLSHLDSSLPLHVAEINDILQQIESQCRKETLFLPANLQQIMHEMKPFTIHPSGIISIEDHMNEKEVTSEIERLPLPGILKPIWRETWLKSLKYHADLWPSEPLFLKWFCQQLLPSLQDSQFDISILLPQLKPTQLFDFYSKSLTALEQLKLAIPKWQEYQNATTIPTLVSQLYWLDHKDLFAWGLLAEQSNCLLLAQLFRFLAKSKKAKLAKIQLERLLLPSELTANYKINSLQKEWGTLIENSLLIHKRMLSQYAQVFIHYDDIQSLTEISEFLSQQKHDLTDIWVLLFNSHQEDKTKLNALINHMPVKQMMVLLSQPDLAYIPFMRTLIAYLQNNSKSIAPKILFQSWCNNQWPLEACLESLVENSKNTHLTSYLSLYGLFLSNHDQLEGIPTKEALARHSESHVLAAFSTSIQPNLFNAEQWQQVSYDGALALLMDDHHFGKLSDDTFLLLAMKTPSDHLVLLQRFFMRQMDNGNACSRLRQWYHHFPETTLSSIQSLSDTQQVRAWLSLIDTLKPSALDDNILKKLPTNDPYLYIAICERVFINKEDNSPLLQWVIEQKQLKSPALIIDYPGLVQFIMTLSQDNRFCPQVIDLNELAKSLLLSNKNSSRTKNILYEALLKQLKFSDGQLVATLALYKDESVLTTLGKAIHDPQQLNKLLGEALPYLEENPEISAKFKLAHKHTKLESNIQAMTGPFQWLRIWFKRLWHQLWVGNSPYIESHRFRRNNPSKQLASNQSYLSPLYKLPKPFNRYSNPTIATATSASPLATSWPKLKREFANQDTFSVKHSLDKAKPKEILASKDVLETTKEPTYLSKISRLFSYSEPNPDNTHPSPTL